MYRLLKSKCIHAVKHQTPSGGRILRCYSPIRLQDGRYAIDYDPCGNKFVPFGMGICNSCSHWENPDCLDSILGVR